MRKNSLKTMARRGIALLAALFLLIPSNLGQMPLAEADEQLPNCGMQEHTHTDECYSRKCVCGQEESEDQRSFVGRFETHKHSDECSDAEGNLICGMVENDYIHEHTSYCYDADGNLVCGLDQRPQPEQTSVYINANGILVCELTNGLMVPVFETSESSWKEKKGHQHDEECYETELSCILAEHTHSNECYPAIDVPEADNEPKVVENPKIEDVEVIEKPEGENSPEDTEVWNDGQSGNPETSKTGELEGSPDGNNNDETLNFEANDFNEIVTGNEPVLNSTDTDVPNIIVSEETGAPTETTGETEDQDGTDDPTEKPEGAEDQDGTDVPTEKPEGTEDPEGTEIPTETPEGADDLDGTDAPTETPEGTDDPEGTEIPATSDDDVNQEEMAEGEEQEADNDKEGTPQPDEDELAVDSADPEQDEDGAPVDQDENVDLVKQDADADEDEIIDEPAPFEGQLVFEGDDFVVTATIGQDAGFPAEIELRVREILPGTEEYRLYSGQTDELLEENWTERGDFARFFDISFVYEDVEYEPSAFVDVQITFTKDIIPVSEDSELKAIHFDQNGPTVLEDAKTDSNETAADVDDAVDTISFSADSFSVFVVVQSNIKTTKVITSAGETYLVEVTYPQEAQIPEGSELVAREITDSDPDYEIYKAQVAAALGAPDAEIPGLFDIGIYKDGDKVTIEAPVTVSIRLESGLERDEQLHVVHFPEGIEGAAEAMAQQAAEAANPETQDIPEQDTAFTTTQEPGVQPEEPVVATEVINDLQVEDQTVTFEASGFSVYALAYTVDFFYGEYEYHLDGGSFMSLKNLLTILNVVEPEQVQDFINNIASATFSDPSLLSISKVEEDTTVGELIEKLGLYPEYSTRLTEEAIAYIKATEIKAVDWAIISLKPFFTEESLTLQMMNGDTYVIRVTDAADYLYWAMVSDTNAGYINGKIGNNDVFTWSSNNNKYSFIYDPQFDSSGHIQNFKHFSQGGNYTIGAVANSGYEFAFWLRIDQNGNMSKYLGETYPCYDPNYLTSGDILIAFFAPAGKKVIVRGNPDAGVDSSRAWHYTANKYIAYYGPGTSYDALANGTQKPDARIPCYNYSDDSAPRHESSFNDSTDRDKYNFLGWYDLDQYLSYGTDRWDGNVGYTKHGIDTSAIGKHVVLIPRYEPKEVYRDYRIVWLDGSDGIGFDSGDNTYYARINGEGVREGAGEAVYHVSKDSPYFTLPNYVMALPEYHSDHHYSLHGWYDISTKTLHQPGDNVKIDNDTVFYAYWFPSDYNFATQGNTISTVDTSSFIHTSVYDYNSLYNMKTLDLNSDSSYISSTRHYEQWDLNSSNGNFLFFTSKGHAGRTVYPNGIWGSYANTNHELAADNDHYNGIPAGVGVPGDLFDSSALGVNYVGSGNYLFKYDSGSGYYIYDSAKNAAAYGNGRFYVYGNTERVKETYGTSDFLPFNSGKTEYSENYGEVDYWFGMRSVIDFYLPEKPGELIDGAYGNRSIKDDEMVYKFSGDDDVWVYVDNHLILDMSGIHGPVYGEINFSRGTYTIAENGTDKTTDSKGIMSYGANGTVTTKKLPDSIADGDHELTLIYLERGASQSNCAIYFNLAPRYQLKLNKVDNATNEKLSGAVFGIYLDEECTLAANVGGAAGDQKNIFTTDANGIATISDLVAGKTYYLKELTAPAGYPDVSEEIIRLSIDRHGLATVSSTADMTEGNSVWSMATLDDTSSSNGTFVLNMTVKNRKQVSITAKKVWAVIDGSNYERDESASVTVKLQRYTLSNTNVETSIPNYKVRILSRYFAEGSGATNRDTGNIVIQDISDYIVKAGGSITFNVSTEGATGLYSVVSQYGTISSASVVMTTGNSFYINGAQGNVMKSGTFTLSNVQRNSDIYVTYIGRTVNGTISEPIITNSNGTVYQKTQDTEFNNSETVDNQNLTVSLNSGNNWKTTWENLQSSANDVQYYYYVKEISSSNGTPNSFQFISSVPAYVTTYSSEGLTGGTITVLNTLQAIKVKLRKRAANGSKENLAGAEFKIYTEEEYRNGIDQGAQPLVVDNASVWLEDQTFNSETGNFVSNELGRFYTGYLPIGRYYIVEEKAPVGYQILTDPVLIEISENGLRYSHNNGENWSTKKINDEGYYNLYIENEEKHTTDISVVKQWSDGTENHTNDTVRVKLYKTYYDIDVNTPSPSPSSSVSPTQTPTPSPSPSPTPTLAPSALVVNIEVAEWYYSDGTTRAEAPNSGWLWTGVQKGQTLDSGNLEPGNSWKKTYTISDPVADGWYWVAYVHYQQYLGGVVDKGTASIINGQNQSVRGDTGEVTYRLKVVLDEEAPRDESSNDISVTINWDHIQNVNFGLVNYDPATGNETYNVGSSGYHANGSQNAITIDVSENITWLGVAIHDYGVVDSGYQLACVVNGVTYTKRSDKNNLIILPAGTRHFTLKAIPQSQSVVVIDHEKTKVRSGILDFLISKASADEIGINLTLPGSDYLPANAVEVENSEIVLNSGNIGWSYTWDELPTTEIVGGETKGVYYYVVETWSSNNKIVSTTYSTTLKQDISTTSEDESGRIDQVQITNTLPDTGTLIITKEWVNVPQGTDVSGLSITVTGPEGYSRNISYRELTENAITIDDLTPGLYTVNENDVSSMVPGYYLVTASSVTSGNANVPANGTGTVTLRNEYALLTYGDISLRKSVSGEGNDPNQEFTFRVSIVDGSGNTVTSVNHKYGDVQFNNGVAELLLTANGELKRITGLPDGTRFMIEEVPDEHYVLGEVTISPPTGANNNNGIITGTIVGGTGSLISIEVENIHIPTVDIHATKTWTNTEGGLIANAVQFTLYTVTMNGAEEILTPVADTESAPNPAVIVKNNGWTNTASWNNLQKYVNPIDENSGLIQYAVKETGVYFGNLVDGKVPEGQWVTNQSVPVKLSDIYQVSYSSGNKTDGAVVIGDDTHEGSITITNEPKTTEVFVEKTWSPDFTDPKYTWEATFALKSDKSSNPISGFTVKSDPLGAAKHDSITITNTSTQFEKTITDLPVVVLDENNIPQRITYTVDETAYTVKYDGNVVLNVENGQKVSGTENVYTPHYHTAITEDGDQTVTISNSQNTNSLVVKKKWMDVLDEDLDTLPDVKFNMMWRYADENDYAKPNNSHAYAINGKTEFTLSAATNWQWTCPVPLPTQMLDEQQNSNRDIVWFVKEKTYNDQNPSVDYVASSINLTDYQKQHFIINVDGYETSDGHFSWTWQQPYQAYLDGNTGTITIRNRAIGEYLQIDIKKKLFAYGDDGALWTVTSFADYMKGLVLDIQIYRRIVEDKPVNIQGHAVIGDSLTIVEPFAPYGERMLVGYEPDGSPVGINPNVFALRQVTSEGPWHWTIGNTEQKRGLPRYGFYTREDGTKIPVRYEYLVVEEDAYKDSQKHPLDEYSWFAINPALWDAVDFGVAGQIVEFERITAQDQDRLVNRQSSDLKITKQWNVNPDGRKVYVKLYRTTNQSYDVSKIEDVTNNGLHYSYDGWLEAQGKGYTCVVDDPDNHVVEIDGQKYIVLDGNETVTIHNVERGSESGGYRYWVKEVGYKDSTGMHLDGSNPVSTVYEITEGYVSALSNVPTEEAGKLSQAIVLGKLGHNHITIKNTVDSVTQKPEISKKLNGTSFNGKDSSGADRQFSFTLTQVYPEASAGKTAYTQTVSSGENGVISFEDIEFTQVGTYIYSIVENGTDDDTMDYDGTTIYAKIDISKPSTALMASAPEYYKNYANGVCSELLTEAMFNNVELGELELKKLVVASAGSELPGDAENQKFSFTISFTAPDNGSLPETVPVTIGNETQTYSITTDGDENTGTITVNLLNNQTAEIKNLPVGITYSISETEVPGYTLSWADSKGDSGTISRTPSEAEATNIFSCIPYTPVAEKKLNGIAFNGRLGDNTTEETFTFDLYEMTVTREAPNQAYTLSDNPIQTKSTASDGSITFDEIKYNVPGTYFYKLIEQGTDTDSMDYDTEPVYLKVVVADDLSEATGTYFSDQACTISAGDKATFNNAELTSIEITKQWLTADGTNKTIDSNKEITFTLYRKVGEASNSVGAGVVKYQWNGTYAYSTNEIGTWTDGSSTNGWGVTSITELPKYELVGNTIAPVTYYVAENETLTEIVTYQVNNDSAKPACDPITSGRIMIINQDAETDLTVIKKDDGTPAKTLSGAVFTLTEVDENGNPIANGRTEDSSETGENGTIVFQNLTPGYYRIAEKTAPAGYNRTNESIIIQVVVEENTVVAKRFGTDKLALIEYERDARIITIHNIPGVELPATGGSGTLIYSVTGLALVLLAGVVLLSRKRKFNA